MYLDTYVLVEIANGNPLFMRFAKENFIISDLTLVEFYYVLLRESSEKKADLWYKKLSAYTGPVPIEIMIEAMKLRIKHRKKKLSFFDAVGYVFALSHDMKFVTGDKEFKEMKNVVFIK